MVCSTEKPLCRPEGCRSPWWHSNLPRNPTRVTIRRWFRPERKFRSILGCPQRLKKPSMFFFWANHRENRYKPRMKTLSEFVLNCKFRVKFWNLTRIFKINYEFPRIVLFEFGYKILAVSTNSKILEPFKVLLTYFETCPQRLPTNQWGGGAPPAGGSQL